MERTRLAEWKEKCKGLMDGRTEAVACRIGDGTERWTKWVRIAERLSS